MRICILGKFPPIQGGVSMRTFRTAHALAARGHEIHVVTNAREATPPFRMHMRAEDWTRCEAQLGARSVTVHWSEPVDRSQSYIPMASPFVTKLASIAGRGHAEHPFDVIFSHYLEPYGVAGYLTSQMTGVPHVVRMAGSDAGRLWHHPQFEALYDHVLRSAERVIAVGTVADRAVQHGVDPRRIVPGGAYPLPEDSFIPEGPILDVNALRDEIGQSPDLREMLWGGFRENQPHFGIYGKLGDNKGSFALLDAMHRLKSEGLDVGLVALAHGRGPIEQRFRERVRELELTDRVLQIPFLPHWRVPEFLRGCLAVCCLEQDFPIGFHSPIISLEVLLCGSCLVASTEVLRKLPQWERLPHGYGCVAVKDVNNMSELSGKLAAIARRPDLAMAVAARGRAFAQDCQQDVEFPARLERILEAAAERRAMPSNTSQSDMSEVAETERFPLTQMASSALRPGGLESQSPFDEAVANDGADLAYAQKVRAGLQEAIANGNTKLQSLAQAVDVEITIAKAETDLDNEATDHAAADPLFRISIGEWALGERALGRLTPVCIAQSRILRFEYDISGFGSVQSVADLPETVGPNPSHIVVFGKSTSRKPLLIDPFTARILELSDGTRTGDQIVGQLNVEFGRTESADHLAWFESLLLSGLIGLRDSQSGTLP